MNCRYEIETTDLVIDLRKNAMPTEARMELEKSRTQLLHHPVYESVQSVENLRSFMQQHVFAVWDFMSLLKRLQQIVTCCELPWVPSSDPTLARFINEIVLGEESDEDGAGGYCSHFELYLSAMREIGADVGPMEEFLTRIRDADSVETALAQARILPSTRQFVESTLQLARDGEPHQVAAAFFYGREDIIPAMFARLVESLPQQGIPVRRLQHYLHRHIELDANDHGPLARKLVNQLCRNQAEKEMDAAKIAIQAVRQRIALWDGIHEELRRSRLAPIVSTKS